MKKVGVTAMLLAAALILCGCTSMLERNYSSSADHVDYSVPEDSSILRAESYQALLNSILYYVSEHSGGGTIRLYNYTGNVETDLAAACSEVMETDPLGAYAVSDIDYTSTRILTYYEIDVHISYRHTIGEVAAIKPVSGQNGVRQQLADLVSNRLTHTVLRTSYFTGDAQLINSLFWLALYSDPVAAYGSPTVNTAFYPEEGSQRILEVEAQWALNDHILIRYQSNLNHTAALLTQDNPPADGTYTVEELATLLRDTLNYDPNGSQTALSALQGEPVNDLGTLLAMEYLCQLYGIEVMPVFDTAEAQTWLIIATPSGYRHLLPRDLRPANPEEAPSETPWTLPLYTDEELTALGFDWPDQLHPACVDYSGPMPE